MQAGDIRLDDCFRSAGVKVNGTLTFQQFIDAMALQLSLITGYKITEGAVLKPEFREKYKNGSGEEVDKTPQED